MSTHHPVIKISVSFCNFYPLVLGILFRFILIAIIYFEKFLGNLLCHVMLNMPRHAILCSVVLCHVIFCYVSTSTHGMQKRFCTRVVTDLLTQSFI